MEQQTAPHFITYDSAEVQYEIKVSSHLSDEKAVKNTIAIVQSILDTRDKSCALTVKVMWTVG